MPTAPGFWWVDRPGLAATLLRSLAGLYGVAAGRRMARSGAKMPVPVVCVGNLVVGGAGKTPTALAVAAHLAQAGHRPAFLSRGYGRDRHAGGTAAVLVVDPDRHTAAEAGDEPLLLARAAPTFVSRDRVAAGREAIAAGATVLVLDDGLQNPALHKSVSLAVVDGAAGLGNGLCLPAGPLRAPLAAQWPQVSAVCIIGAGRPGGAVARLAEAEGRAVLRARLAPDESTIAALRGQPLFAFAGIGRPGKFYDTLETHGLLVRGRRSFPDHHRYRPDDLDALARDAGALGACLVTTAKDRVRLPASFPALELPVSLQFDDEDALKKILVLALAPSAGRHGPDLPSHTK